MDSARCSRLRRDSWDSREFLGSFCLCFCALLPLRIHLTVESVISVLFVHVVSVSNFAWLECAFEYLIRMMNITFSIYINYNII